MSFKINNILLSKTGTQTQEIVSNIEESITTVNKIVLGNTTIRKIFDNYYVFFWKLPIRNILSLTVIIKFSDDMMKFIQENQYDIQLNSMIYDGNTSDDFLTTANILYNLNMNNADNNVLKNNYQIMKSRYALTTKIDSNIPIATSNNGDLYLLLASTIDISDTRLLSGLEIIFLNY